MRGRILLLLVIALAIAALAEARGGRGGGGSRRRWLQGRVKEQLYQVIQDVGRVLLQAQLRLRDLQDVEDTPAQDQSGHQELRRLHGQEELQLQRVRPGGWDTAS